MFRNTKPKKDKKILIAEKKKKRVEKRQLKSEKRIKARRNRIERIIRRLSRNPKKNAKKIKQWTTRFGKIKQNIKIRMKKEHWIQSILNGK